MSDTPRISDQRAVFTLLGELSADVKHILARLDKNNLDFEQMRQEHREEIRGVNHRLDQVERFNTRVLTAGALALPVVLAAVNWGVPAILEYLKG